MTQPLFSLLEISTVSVLAAWIFTAFLPSAAWKHFCWLLALAAPVLALPILFVPLRFEVPVASSRPAAAFESLEPAAISEAIQTALLASPDPKPSPLPAFWLAGALSYAGVLILGHLRVRLRLRAAVPLDRNELDVVCAAVFIRRRIGFLLSEHTRIPFCYGFLRPVIVVPAAFAQWGAEKRKACLLHEALHLKRADLFSALLAQVSCMICWFNPLVWFAAGRLHSVAETATDDAVLGAGLRAEVYADNLLSIGSEARRRFPFSAAIPMARSAGLKRRLINILNEAANRNIPRRRAVVTGLFAVTLATAVLASVRLVEGKDAREAGGPSVDDLAQFLDISFWKTRVSLPMGAFSVQINAFENGKYVNSLLVYDPPARKPSGEPETPISILMAPSGDDVKVRLTFFWKNLGLPGSNSLSQIAPRGKAVAGAGGSWARSLPPTVSVGEYVLCGDTDARQSFDVPPDKASDYLRCYVLKIQKIGAK